MTYLPLNNSNCEVGDEVLCIENRFAKVFDYDTGFRRFGDETLKFLTLQETYKILEKDPKRRKIKILADDGVERMIPYYRMGIKEKED